MLDVCPSYIEQIVSYDLVLLFTRLMLFIHMSNKHLLLLSFLLCLLISVIGASITSSNEKKMDRLISNICDELYNNDESDAIENSKWEHLCRSWLQLYGRDQQNKEEMIDGKFG